MTVKDMLDNWKLMSLSREFDLYIKEFAKTDEAVGYLHTSIGQEASSVGIIKQLRADDWMTSTYRNHSHGVASGLDLYKMVAELLGKRTGYCKGLGGSMHIADQDINFIGSMGIVAGGIPIATGAAWGSKMKGTDQVALCFFGEGAIHQGAFHEGLEFAIKFEAPVTATHLVRSLTSFSSAAISSRPVCGSNGVSTCSAPESSQAIRHGETLASWSKRVPTIRSPGFRV